MAKLTSHPQSAHDELGRYDIEPHMLAHHLNGDSQRLADAKANVRPDQIAKLRGQGFATETDDECRAEAAHDSLHEAVGEV